MAAILVVCVGSCHALHVVWRGWFGRRGKRREPHLHLILHNLSASLPPPTYLPTSLLSESWDFCLWVVLCTANGGICLTLRRCLRLCDGTKANSICHAWTPYLAFHISYMHHITHLVEAHLQVPSVSLCGPVAFLW